MDSIPSSLITARDIANAKGKVNSAALLEEYEEAYRAQHPVNAMSGQQMLDQTWARENVRQGGKRRTRRGRKGRKSKKFADLSRMSRPTHFRRPAHLAPSAASSASASSASSAASSASASAREFDYLLSRGDDRGLEAYLRRTGRPVLVSGQFNKFANQGRLSTLRILLAHGLDPNQLLADGRPLVTEIKNADFRKAAPIYHLLVEAGADVNLPTTSNENMPPMQFIVRDVITPSDRLELIQWFLDHGADVNQQDQSGQTLLMRLAFRFRHDDINAVKLIRLLLERGANVALEDNNGETVMDKAKDGPLAAILRGETTQAEKNEKALLNEWAWEGGRRRRHHKKSTRRRLGRSRGRRQGRKSRSHSK